MRQYKVIKRKGGRDEGIVIGAFKASNNRASYAFARLFCNFIIESGCHDASYGFEAVPLCEGCGRMLVDGEVKRQVYEGQRDPASCDKCHYKDTMFGWGKGLDDEYADERTVG